ncbi:KH domain-containing protein akap-1 [Vespa velutina]|uniref:KH domain-containing protein akap-1 n=1 Tax=Vespa velutina TaxID=202808 RepID=UPI001FB3999E|nr:KH domain-containing protein akap-1 [Vespa velutina]XP_047365683.1 KH domain-containing protein akap-1 [Vespa velutina]XP_047365684.1 KH domain-containing protein akap-1 [Vespa velutina]
MSSTHIQIVKWSFPAFALLIGLLWYKRRRVDRADPGGISTLNVKETNNDVNTKLYSIPSNEDLNLSDSGIHANDSFSSLFVKSIDEPIDNTEDINAKVDISIRRSVTSPISVPSAKSLEDNQDWYKDVETISNMEIQLGSNPNISNFDVIARSMGATAYSNDTSNDKKIEKIFKDIPEEKESSNVHEITSSSIDKQEEINHPSIFAESKEQLQNYPAEEENKIQTQALSERDSANYSPVSGVLEGSVTDEARSEGSTDSGKGGSIKGQIKDVSLYSVYEFCICQNLVGRLIGRHGSFLQNICAKAGVHIMVKRHHTLRDQKICVIQGSIESITIALDIIRQRFPEKKYPSVTLEQILPVVIPEEIPVLPELTQLSLVEGVNNDVLVCHISKPNRLFLHIPTHPTYPSLRLLDANMTQLYNSTESPMVTDELTKGMILVANWYDRWVRVYVEDPDPRGEMTLVRLVDHGGYWTFRNANMRKIRSDFLSLPFQAIEVFLANLQPKNGDWEQEAYNIVGRMCSGIIGQAQIVAYINANVYINFFLNIPKHGVISLADELIARGYAESVSLECLVSDEDTVVAS